MTVARHRADVSLIVDGSPTAIDVTDVSLTIDESWQPYVQARVTALGSVARFADPRKGHRLAITLTNTTTGDSVPASLLSVRSSGVDYATGAVTLVAASGESEVADLANMSTGDVGPSVWAGIREGVEDLLTNYAHVPTSRQDLSALPYDTNPELASGALFRPGDRWWSVLSDLPRRIGWNVWVGLDGIWRLAATEPVPDTVPVGTLSVGVDVMALSADTTREEGGTWADAAVAVYEWTDSTNVRHRVVGTASEVTGATRVMTVNGGAVAVDQGQASARAASALALARTRGQTITVQVPARYDLRPRQVWDVVGPSSTVRVYVTRVTWDLPAGTATIAGRVLSNVTDLVQWQDVDPATRWTDVNPSVRWLDVAVPDPDALEVAA